MTGSTPFSIDKEKSENFQRSFKKLAKAYKAYKGKFVDIVEEILENLPDNPYPQNSIQEPLPSRIKLPENWTFHKLKFKVSEGASGHVRLMYLVNAVTYTIRLVWIYSHEQFAKRPADLDLKKTIAEILDD